MTMNRKHTNTDSKLSSSSYLLNALVHRDRDSNYYYNDDVDDESSSGDLSSNFHGYSSQPLLKIIKPPSYASMQQRFMMKRVSTSTASINTTRSHTNDTRYSSVYSFIVSSIAPLQRKTSIYGPTGSTKERAYFLGIISLMTFCGSNNDFLGKICYQSLPGIYSGYIGLKNRYWIAWLLTIGTFIICCIAIIFGWEKGEQWKNFKKERKLFMFNVSIPGSCDVWVNGGRYIGLVFLPASVVTILKNGTQLLFSALFRIIFEKKTLSKLQTLGILFVVIGLTLVCISIFLNEMSSSFGSILIGIFILITVGLFGSLRNHYEQILCRDMKYNANFVVGMRSFISIFWTVIIGIILLCIPVLYENKYNNYTSSIGSGWNQIYFAIIYICSYPIFIIGFILFLIAIYGKNVTQMKVIELSSALTRNLTMQLMPIGTWLLSLLFYYIINEKYGEQWNKYSYIRLIGFIIVLCGSYLYMKIPKDELHEMQQIKINKKIITSTHSFRDIDLYGTADVISPTSQSNLYDDE